jgi:hypothetical protein
MVKITTFYDIGSFEENRGAFFNREDMTWFDLCPCAQGFLVEMGVDGGVNRKVKVSKYSCRDCEMWPDKAPEIPLHLAWCHPFPSQLT